MRHTVSAVLIAASMLTASAAVAEERGPATDGARGGERFNRLSPEDHAAFVDARIAALRAGLRLTPEQEKNWPAVENAMRDLAKQRGEAKERSREARRSDDPIGRLRAAADAMGARSAGLKRLADASEPLYRSLDEAQKRRLNMLTRQAMGMGMQHGPRRGPR